MTTARRRTLAVAALAAALLAGPVAVAVARSGGTPEPSGTPAARGSATPSRVPVIVPGRPGESASVLPADEVRAPDGSAYNTFDAWFVRMMIPHHLQALQMAALAPGRAADPRVRAVADRVRAAQAPEVEYLRGWLRARGLAESDSRERGHDHHTMPGMQSMAELRALEAARGAAFDRMFLAMMSEHHQGAVDMAGELVRLGQDRQVEQLATAIATEQSVEIARMRELGRG